MNAEQLQAFQCAFIYAITRLKIDEESLVRRAWNRMRPDYDGWGVALSPLPPTRLQRCVRAAERATIALMGMIVSATRGASADAPLLFEKTCGDESPTRNFK
ncbi:hypothetical protein HY970_01750 [Candidatus Kaiserbacteria bacterium]|nr:hypothetical protein [Candidatus Kaiserbacteria bacterium]